MIRLVSVFCFALAVVIWGAACSKSGPPPLTLEELPGAINTAFQTGKMQPKKNAEAIAKLISSRQYAAASIQLQALLANPDLTQEQREVLSSAFKTINETLQAQVAAMQPEGTQSTEGAPKPPPAPPSTEEAAAAAAALDHYRATK